MYIYKFIYLDSKIYQKTKKIAFHSGKKHQDSLPGLYNIAISILQTPATSSSIERVFSVAALSNGQKNRRA